MVMSESRNVIRMLVFHSMHDLLVESMLPKLDYNKFIIVVFTMPFKIKHTKGVYRLTYLSHETLI